MKIEVIRRATDYIAQFAHDPGFWEVGKTFEEALGKLLISQQQRIGVKIEFYN